MLAIAVGTAVGWIVFLQILLALRLRRVRARDRKWEKVDPMEFARRAEAASMRHKAIMEEVRQCTDPDKVDVLETESKLILDNVRAIRLEQIDCQNNGWRRRRSDTPLEVPR